MIDQTAATAAQPAMNTFTGCSSSSQAVVPERNALIEGNVPFEVQETLNATAVDGASGNDISSISSASQQDFGFSTRTPTQACEGDPLR